MILFLIIDTVHDQEPIAIAVAVLPVELFVVPGRLKVEPLVGGIIPLPDQLFKSQSRGAAVVLVVGDLGKLK